MPKVFTVSKKFSPSHVLDVEVGTNCPQGGDTELGGRTLIRFTDLVATDMKVRIGNGNLLEAETVELVFGGDAKCETLIEALEFAIKTLTLQSSTSVSIKEEMLQSSTSVSIKEKIID